MTRCSPVFAPPASLDIADKLDAGERLTLDDGVRLFDVARSARGRLARQPRAREAARRAHLLQLQHPPRSDQRLRGELPVLLVRAAEAGRPGRLHDVARGGVGQAAAARAPAAHRSPRRQRPASRSAVRLLHGAAARLQADPARHPPEVLHRRRDRVLRRSLRHDRRAGAARADGGRARFAAGRRRRDLRRARAPEDLRTTSAAPIAISTFTASRIGSACART